MTRFLAAIAVLVVCAAVPAVAGAQPPPNPPDLRITTTPNPVKFGEDVRIFGELTRRPGSGITIELSEDPFPFDAFATVATALTDVGSGYSFTRTPTVNTRYQTRQGATTSRIATALVRPSISLRVSSRRLATGRSVRFSGRVCPEHVGASLAIQRRMAPKRWRTVRRTTLAAFPAARVPATRAGCGSAAAASTARSLRHTPTTPMAVAGNAGSTCPDRRRPAVPTCRLLPVLAQPATTHSAARASTTARS